MKIFLNTTDLKNPKIEITETLTPDQKSLLKEGSLTQVKSEIKQIYSYYQSLLKRSEELSK